MRLKLAYLALRSGNPVSGFAEQHGKAYEMACWRQYQRQTSRGRETTCRDQGTNGLRRTDWDVDSTRTRLCASAGVLFALYSDGVLFVGDQTSLLRADSIDRPTLLLPCYLVEIGHTPDGS